MKDNLVKALALNEEIRAYSICATAVVKEAQQRHQTFNGATLALGQGIIASLLLGATLKGEDKITVKIQGNGPLGNIVIDSNGKGTVKGYVTNPETYIQPNEENQPSLPATIGSGILTVIKDLGLKEPFSGQVPLTGELSQDFTYYMAVSEQVPSAISLSVLLDEEGNVQSAGGFMIQVLPGASEESIEKVENSLAHAGNYAKKLAAGKTPADILTDLLGEDVTVLEEMPVAFQCDCSKEKFASAIVTLGKDEIQQMMQEDEGAEAVCRFCGNKYTYTKSDLEELLKNAE